MHSLIFAKTLQALYVIETSAVEILFQFCRRGKISDACEKIVVTKIVKKLYEPHLQTIF